MCWMCRFYPHVNTEFWSIHQVASTLEHTNRNDCDHLTNDCPLSMLISIISIIVNIPNNFYIWSRFLLWLYLSRTEIQLASMWFRIYRRSKINLCCWGLLFRPYHVANTCHWLLSFQPTQQTHSGEWLSHRHHFKSHTIDTWSLGINSLGWRHWKTNDR